jgi:hypothetical protein
VLPSGLRRRKARQARVVSLTEEIQLLERALESVQSERQVPAAYGPAQRLRGSILEGELARARMELDALRAGLSPAGLESPAELDAEPSSPSHDLTDKLGSHATHGSMRARILLASVAAVAVLLGVARLPMPQAPEAQAADAIPIHQNLEDAGAPGDQPVAAPASEVMSSNAVPDASQPMSGIPVNLPSVDYFEGWTASAPPDRAARPSEADSDEFLAVAATEQATITGHVQTLAAVRLREQPATTARTVRSIAAGSRLDALSGGTPGWTQVRAPDGTTGWIVASALRSV